MNLTNSAAFLEVVVAQVVERWHSVCKKTSAAFFGYDDTRKVVIRWQAGVWIFQLGSMQRCRRRRRRRRRRRATRKTSINVVLNSNEENDGTKN